MDGQPYTVVVPANHAVLIVPVDNNPNIVRGEE